MTGEERGSRDGLDIESAYEQIADVLATSPSIAYTAQLIGDRMVPTWVSESIATVLGYTPRAALADGWWWQNLHPDDRPVDDRAVRELRRAGHHSHQYRFLRTDGSYAWILDQHKLLLDEPGVERVVGSWSDITSAREQQERLEAAEAHYRRLITTSPYAVYAVDRDGVFTELNPAGEALLGRTDLVGRPFTDVLAPESASYGMDAFARIIAGEANDIELEILVRRPDGERRLLGIAASAILDEVVIGVHGIARDITEERRIQAERERAFQQYERLVTTSPDAIYALDLEGRFTEVSHATARLLERSVDELLGLPFAAIIDPDDLHIANAAFSRRIAGHGEVAEMEVHVVRPSGERRLAHIRAAPIMDGDRVIGSHGIGRDITDERARRERLLLLAAVLDRLPEGVSVTDDGGRTIYCNASYSQLVGEGIDDPFVLVPEGSAQREEMRAAVRTAGVWRGSLALDRGPASLPIEMTSVEVRLDAQALTFTLLRDITDEVGREQQLRRAERLASVATLVGGVAHELNNPLTAIAGFAELMLLEDRPRDDLEVLRLMKREASRAAKIVADLRVLTRQSQDAVVTERAPVDLNDVVRNVVRLQRYSLETASIEVVDDLAADLPHIHGVASELEQVVLNLVVNARQALEQQREQERRLTLRTRRSAAGVSLTVADNGPGIGGDHIERIFDPFFTTRSPGQGMGLGLSLVHRIVAEHGGQVLVESDPGAGATFLVTLPATAAAATDPRGDRTHSGTGALRILLVDDEEAIRRVAARFFTRRGHVVDVASDGAEALSMIGRQSYDVILTDLRMPGMSGEVLLQTLQERDPDAARRVALMTGHVARDDEALAVRFPGVPVLEKPFSLPDLQRHVEDLAARVRADR
jgi:PAS domain S-box-containing protein